LWLAVAMSDPMNVARATLEAPLSRGERGDRSWPQGLHERGGQTAENGELRSLPAATGRQQAWGRYSGGLALQGTDPTLQLSETMIQSAMFLPSHDDAIELIQALVGQIDALVGFVDAFVGFVDAFVGLVDTGDEVGLKPIDTGDEISLKPIDALVGLVDAFVGFVDAFVDLVDAFVGLVDTGDEVGLKPIDTGDEISLKPIDALVGLVDTPALVDEMKIDGLEALLHGGLLLPDRIELRDEQVLDLLDQFHFLCCHQCRHAYT
jgi:hypothetical protein